MKIRWRLALLALICGGCGAAWPEMNATAIREAGAKIESEGGYRVVRDELVVRTLDAANGELLVESRSRRVYQFVSQRLHTWRESAHYSRLSDEVPVVRARVTQPDGQVREYEDEEASDLPTSGGVYFDDARVRVLEVNGLRQGTVLEYEVVHRHREAGWVPLATFVFGESVPVEFARLEVITPSGVEIEWASRTRTFEPEKRPGARPGEVSHVWQRQGLAAIATEPHGAPAAWIAERVDVALKAFPGGRPLRTSAEVSKWQAELNEPRAAPTEAIRQKVAEILGPEGQAQPPEERARLLNAWVRDKIRYVAIEAGLSGYQSEFAERTMTTLYGDCKAKAVLLKSMLTVAGVSSRLALIRSGSIRRERYVPIRGVANFNHMILIADLPKGPQPVDPTSPYVSFGDLPASDQDKVLLPVDPAGLSKLIRQKPSDPEANGTRAAMKLAVDEGGLAVGKYELRARGTAAEAMRDDLLAQTPEARLKSARTWVPLGDLTVESIVAERLEPTVAHLPVDLKGTLKRRDPMVFRGQTAVLQVADLLDRCFGTPTREKRRTTAYFGPPRRDEVTLELALPPGWQVLAPAAPVEAKTPAGEYLLTVAQSPSGLSVTRSCQRNVNRLPARRYAEYGHLAETSQVAEGRPIVLKRVQK